MTVITGRIDSLMAGQGVHRCLCRLMSVLVIVDLLTVRTHPLFFKSLIVLTVVEVNAELSF